MDTLSELARLSRLWAFGISEAIDEIGSLAPQLVPLGPQLENQLHNDPLYVRYGFTEPPSRNEKPWHAIGCQRMAARMAIHAGYRDDTTFTLSPDLLRWGRNEPPLPAPIVGLMLAGAILHAQPFLWSNRAESRLQTFSRWDKPPAIQRNRLPAPLTFWARESSLASATDPEQRQDWLLLIDQGPGCLAMVANVRHLPTGQIGFLVDGLPTDEPLPPVSSSRLCHIAAMIGGMLDLAADPKRASRQAAQEAGPNATVVVIKGGIW